MIPFTVEGWLIKAVILSAAKDLWIYAGRRERNLDIARRQF
jgi:hypothetical protein